MTNLNNFFFPHHFDRTKVEWENSTMSDPSAEQVLSYSLFPSIHYIPICNQNQEIHGLVVSGKKKKLSSNAWWRQEARVL